MKKTGILLLLTLTLWSCEEEIPEVSFRIETEGFILQEAYIDNSDVFPSFSHRLSSGRLTFSNNHDTYKFNTGRTGIEEYLFQVPVGEYQLTFTIPQASLYGQEGGSFVASPRNVIINEQTDTILVQVEANCSMFMVYDQLNQLDQGVFMIERHAFAHGFFWSYPLLSDSLSGAYYTYFTPDSVPSNPSAFLWFYEGTQGIEEGGMATMDFEIGYQYNINILD
ncbi:MAG: hypothetical protein GY790_11795 [Bacteroidetes bacterium]|nr:hypothetical protein [Bacteroidota bacterium]